MNERARARARALIVMLMEFSDSMTSAEGRRPMTSQPHGESVAKRLH